MDNKLFEPRITVCDQNVMLIETFPGVELRTCIIDGGLWYAWFYNQTPVTDAYEGAKV